MRMARGEASKEEGEMACSRPAMEMDLSAQAWLLIREARDENSQEMEERLWSRAPECNLKVYFFPWDAMWWLFSGGMVVGSGDER